MARKGEEFGDVTRAMGKQEEELKTAWIKMILDSLGANEMAPVVEDDMFALTVTKTGLDKSYANRNKTSSNFKTNVDQTKSSDMTNNDGNYKINCKEMLLQQ